MIEASVNFTFFSSRVYGLNTLIINLPIRHCVNPVIQIELRPDVKKTRFVSYVGSILFDVHATGPRMVRILSVILMLHSSSDISAQLVSKWHVTRFWYRIM